MWNSGVQSSIRAKVLFYVDGTDSYRFATTSDTLGSGGGGADQGDATHQSVIVTAPEELLDNYFTSATDPADNFFEFFAALQHVFRDFNANFPSTVGRPLGVLSDLVNNTPHYEVSIARLNTELREAVYKRQEAKASLAIRGTELAQSTAAATHLTVELIKAVDGRQASEASLSARDSDFAKLSMLLDSSILKLATECFKSTEAT